MKFIILLLFLTLLPSVVLAGGGHPLSCSVIVVDEPRTSVPLRPVPTPFGLLPLLGFQTYWEPLFNGVGHRFTIANRWNPDSPQAKLLRDFSHRWPQYKFQFYYTASKSWEASQEIDVILSTVTPSGLLIPTTTLARADVLETHLMRIEESLKKLQILRQQAVRFSISQFSSKAFHLLINFIPEEVTVPVLKLMRNRMIRHRLHLCFADESTTDYLTGGVLGVSVDDYIFLTNRALLSKTVSTMSVFAHEVEHGMNTYQLSLGRHPEKMIMYDAGELNTEGLLGIPESYYNRYFRSDEVEGWEKTERIEQTPWEESLVPQFLDSQWLWLTELKTRLSDFAEGKNEELLSSILGTEEGYLSLSLHPNPAQEVIIKIPIVSSRMEEMGALDYLIEVIDTRLRQLTNLRKVRELRQQRREREDQEARENTILRWWVQRLLPP